LKIISISDTHCYHRKIKIPDGDVLVHAGDITRRGEIAVIDDFAQWIQTLPHKSKILISGNHDFSLERENFQKDEILKRFQEAGIIYLQDSGIEIDGIYFYGSPATPIWHSRWAFNYFRENTTQWDHIPENTNVLITHGPPYQILDRAPRSVFDYEHTGCKILADKIWELPKLKAHIFGHIHEDYGTHEERGIKFINSAICTGNYQPTNLPQEFEI
jgi:Icc-related predicted phosphoesterase